jgi:uncharacterized membrane protein YfcA
MNIVVAAIVVFVVFGIMSMAGLGAATVFIPIFYYTGMPLPEAISTGLLLNVVSLGFSIPAHVRAKTINVRLVAPIVVVAMLLAPVGAAVSGAVDRDVLLALFAVFLVVSAGMMLFYRPAGEWNVARPIEIATGTAVGGGAGFLSGLLGVGGGAFVLPVLNGIGLETREAAATTAVVALTSSIVAFIARASLGGLDYVFTGVMVVAAAAGASLATRFSTQRLSPAALKRIVAVVLFLIAVKIVWDLLR